MSADVLVLTPNQNSRVQSFSSSSVRAVVFSEKEQAEQALTHPDLNLAIGFYCGSAHSALFALRHQIVRQTAQQTQVHGVCVAVNGCGILLSGVPEVGKSQLALELLQRGHQLVADDVVELRKLAPQVLEASAPELLKGFMQVRSLGVLNVKKMYGSAALSDRTRIDLILNLTEAESNANDPQAYLSGFRGNRQILDVAVPTIEINLSAIRNLSSLLEAAAADVSLRKNGYSADIDLAQRQLDAVSAQFSK